MKYNPSKDIDHEEESESEKDDLSFKKYFEENKINYFDENLFPYHEKNIKNEFNKVLVIMDEDIDEGIYNISSLKIIKISDIIVLDNNNNNYQELFIKNNLELILKIIKEEINKNEIDEIMMHSLLKIIKKLINYLDKENILFFFKFIWDFYDKNKIEENNWIFMSKEYIENILIKYYDLNIYIISNIPPYNIEFLSNHFIFFIKGNSFCIKFKIDGLMYIFNNCLRIPFKNEFNDNIKTIYNKQYQTKNLLFSEYMKDSKEKILYNDSILFVEFFDKIQLLNILKNTRQKNSIIKAIITRTKNKENKSEIINFIIDNKIY